MEFLSLSILLAIPLFFYNKSIQKKMKVFTSIFNEEGVVRREVKNQEYRTSNLRGEVNHLTKVVARRVSDEKIEELESELSKLDPEHTRLKAQLSDLESEYNSLRPKSTRKNSNRRTSSSSRKSSSSSSYYDDSSSRSSSSSSYGSGSSSSSDWGGGGGSFSGGGSSDSW